MADDPHDRVLVTMKGVSLAPNGDILQTGATDWVGRDIVDAYVAEAQSRWQVVTVDYDAVIPVEVVDAGYATDHLNLDTTPSEG